MNSNEKQIILCVQEIETILLSERINKASISKPLKNLYYLKQYQTIINFFEHSAIPKYENKLLNKIYVFTIHKLIHPKKFSPILIRSFILFKDYDYLLKLKTISSIPVWEKRLNNILTIIKKQEDIETLLLVLRKEKNWNELKKQLKILKNWDHFKNHAFYIYEIDRYGLLQILEYYIDFCVKLNFDEDKINSILRFIRINFDKQFYNKFHSYYESKTR